MRVLVTDYKVEASFIPLNVDEIERTKKRNIIRCNKLQKKIRYDKKIIKLENEIKKKQRNQFSVLFRRFFVTILCVDVNVLINTAYVL